MKGEVTRGEVTRGENGRGESARAAAKKSSGPSGWRSDRNRRVGPPEPPPVMVRGRDPSAFGVPTTPLRSTKKGSQRARRTYNVALGSQGAEMRLPALPHIHIGWRVASFLLAGLLIYGLYSLWNSSLYRVESAEIFGLQRVGANLVSSVLDVNDKPVFALNSQTMQQDLLATFP